MSSSPRRLPLLHAFTLPAMAGVAALTAAIGWLSYRSAYDAAQEQAARGLQAQVQRVGEAWSRRTAQAQSVLTVAFAEGVPAPVNLESGLDNLRERFWAAASIHPEPHGQVYFANRAGQYLAVRRLSTQDGEQVWRLDPAGPAQRQIFRPALGALQPPDVVADLPDPRQQAWFREAQAAEGAAWTAVELRPEQQSLTLSRARRVAGLGGVDDGVVATDIALRSLQDMLATARPGARGVAFIAEHDGLLLSDSEGRALHQQADGRWLRRTAAASGSPIMAAAYVAALPHLGGASVNKPSVVTVRDGMPEPMMAAFARLADPAGQDWAIVVAEPVADFSREIVANVARTAALGLLALAVLLVGGAWLQRRTARDAAELMRAAQAVGDGDLDHPPGPMAGAELEGVAESMRRMQLRLRTDRLTGLANRDALLTRLHDRMRPGRRQKDGPKLALMFVDLDRFKDVNDRLGHEAGDTVLATLGRRLRQTVRDTDLVARWASDEFVLLLDGVGSEDSAEFIRDQVERVLRDPVEISPGGPVAELAGTVGVALYPDDATDPDELMRAAEADMVRRKPASVSQW